MTGTAAPLFAGTSLNARDRKVEWLVRALLGLMTALLILPVVIIMALLVVEGGPVISWEFLTSPPVDGLTAGGILPALVGTVWLVVVALIASVPVGVAAA
ncbi:MAG: phosphate ABC transporter, permease protein PstA, partial [Gammaproteobacteria bacterium]|nr:phosphate ABC transporter, permease protein PstA [Gammaproteobacteria bacterium]